jgi:HNH endonuclease
MLLTGSSFGGRPICLLGRSTTTTSIGPRRSGLGASGIESDGTLIGRLAPRTPHALRRWSGRSLTALGRSRTQLDPKRPPVALGRPVDRCTRSSVYRYVASMGDRPRARTVCSVPGCPHARPCPVHRDTRRRGSTRAWRRLRDQVLARDRYRCRECGAPARDVHHVLPRSAGGRDEAANLRSLCRRCHAARHSPDSLPAS